MVVLVKEKQKLYEFIKLDFYLIMQLGMICVR